MALLSKDTFNRADSTSNLGSTDGAGSKDPIAWVQANGTLGINTNQGYASAVVSSRALTYVDLAQADVDISLTLATQQPGALTIGIVFRYVDSANYWVWFNNNGTTELAKIVASVVNVVGSTFSGGADGDVLRVVTAGNSIQVYRNGVLKTNTEDSFQATATKHGWQTGSTAYRVDNWLARSTVVPSVVNTQTPTIGKQISKTISVTQTQSVVLVPSLTHNKALSVTQTQTPPSIATHKGTHNSQAVTVTQTQTATRTSAKVAVRVPLLSETTIYQPDIANVVAGHIAVPLIRVN